MLRVLAESVIRELVATKPLLRDKDQTSNALEILTIGRGPLEEEIRRRVQGRCDHLQLGIELLPRGVCLQEVHPPRAVVGAFRDVSSAFKERARMKSEANAYYREQLIDAAGSSAWKALEQQRVDLDDQQMIQLWGDLRRQQSEAKDEIPAIDEALLAGQAAVEMNLANAFAWQQRLGAEGEANRFDLTQSAHGL